MVIRAVSNYAARLFLTLEEFIIEWEVISLGSSTISLVIMLDFISLYFISLVRLVAGRVIVFSTSYMSTECFLGRFVALVIAFISIFILILSPNIVSLMLG